MHRSCRVYIDLLTQPWCERNNKVTMIMAYTHKEIKIIKWLKAIAKICMHQLWHVGIEMVTLFLTCMHQPSDIDQ